MIGCSSDESKEPTDFTIWDGPKITFVKEPGTDPNDEANQDSITPSVSITRANSGGEIYNILREEGFTKGSSPAGTEWAVGDISNIQRLSFSSFREAVGSPKEVVGKSLVLHIIEEDVYLAVEFKTWAAEQNGSFSYERSTENTAPAETDS